MLVKLIHALGALVGLWTLRDSKDRTAIIITLVLVVSTALAFSGTFVTLAMIIYSLALLAVLAYAFFRIAAGPTRAVVLAMVLPVLSVLFFGMMHWPGKGFVPCLLVISLWAYVQRIIPQRNTFRNEFGFLTVLFADAVGMLFTALGA